MKKICVSILFLLLIFNILFINTSYGVDTSNLNVFSPSVILIDSKSGKTIYEKNSNQVLYPASVTKIMTAILAIENCKLDERATASYNAVMSVPVGYSHANILVGEELSIENLLYATLIPSANDAANILAEHVSGSISSFVTVMNTKALELGCKNTNFVNPSGIHDDNHYTTSYDLSLIAKYAMQNEMFRKIVSTKSYTLPSTEAYPKNDRMLNTTNELLKVNNSSSPSNYYYEYANGIKTGFTNKAKETLVASAVKDNMEFIIVVMNSEKTPDGFSARFTDTKNLFNFAFNTYEMKNIVEANSVVEQVTISNATSKTKNLDLLISNSISGIVEKSDLYNIAPEIKLNENLKAPILKDTVVGTISYNLNGVEYKSNLLAANNVIKSNFIGILFTIIIVLFIGFIIRNLFYGKPKKKKRRKNTSNSYKMKYY